MAAIHAASSGARPITRASSAIIGPGSNTATRPRTDLSPVRNCATATADAAALSSGTRGSATRVASTFRRAWPSPASSMRRWTTPESRYTNAACAQRPVVHSSASPGARRSAEAETACPYISDGIARVHIGSAASTLATLIGRRSRPAAVSSRLRCNWSVPKTCGNNPTIEIPSTNSSVISSARRRSRITQPARKLTRAPTDSNNAISPVPASSVTAAAINAPPLARPTASSIRPGITTKIQGSDNPEITSTK